MSKKKKIVIISAIVLCIIIGVVTILVLKNNRSNKNDKVECEMFTGGSYNLKFETNGGDKIESMTICIACSPDSYEEIPTPIKEGEIFEGWYYDEKFEKKVTDTSTGNIEPKEDIDKNNCLIGYKDITLYAKWSTTEIEDTSDDETSKEDKEESSKTAYCEDGYTLSGNQCIGKEVINASKVENCPEGYEGGGKGMCVYTSDGVSIDKLHCAEGSVGPNEREDCLINPNEMTQDECSYHGYYWYNDICYRSITSPLCPDGDLPSSYGHWGVITYFCDMYSDGTERFTFVETQYACPSGYSLDGTKCVRTVTAEVKYR